VESSAGKTEHWRFRTVVQLLVQLLLWNFSYEMLLIGLVFLLPLAHHWTTKLLLTFIAEGLLCLLREVPWEGRKTGLLQPLLGIVL